MSDALLNRDRARASIEMHDLAAYQTERRITDVSHNARTIKLRWDDAKESTFHAAWLRDNCACSACRHPQTMERTFQLVDEIDPIVIEKAEITDNGGLFVAFSGVADRAHGSIFDAGWVRHHCYSEWARRERQLPRILWDAGLASDIPSFRHGELMKSDAVLREWLEALLNKGVTVVREVPPVIGEVRRIAQRVGPLRETNFGAVFDVESKPKPNNSAYTAMGLEPHTDLPNVSHPPDFQLLLCITNEARGGRSILVDGFRVAEEFRAKDVEGFHLLAREPIEFRFHDESCDLRHSAPVIALDRDGNLHEIRFSNWLRTAPDLSGERMELFYAALMRFWRLLREPRFQLRPRLATGEMIAFDNRRILHGREPFDPNTGQRHLQGCYLDRETVESRLRLISRNGGRSEGEFSGGP